MEILLNQHIESSPEVRSGKPRIADTRITVADIAIMYLRMGQSLELIAGKYDLAPAAVYVAMGYYYDHRDEIDRSIQDDEAFVDTFMQNNPSRLQDKLKLIHET